MSGHERLPIKGLALRDLVALLDRMADETNDVAVRRAARAIRHQPPGRPPINDDAALAEAERLLATGAARSMRAALMRVARVRAGHGNAKSVYERLRRKSARMKKCAT